MISVAGAARTLAGRFGHPIEGYEGKAVELAWHPYLAVALRRDPVAVRRALASWDRRDLRREIIDLAGRVRVENTTRAG